MNGFFLRKGIAAFCAAVVCFSFSGCASIPAVQSSGRESIETKPTAQSGGSILASSSVINDTFAIKDSDGNIALDSSHVQSVQLTQEIDAAAGVTYHAVWFHFNEAGTQAFATLTRNCMGETTGIYIGDTLLSEPMIKMEITDGVTYVSLYDEQQAYEAFKQLTE